MAFRTAKQEAYELYKGAQLEESRPSQAQLSAAQRCYCQAQLSGQPRSNCQGSATQQLSGSANCQVSRAAVGLSAQLCNLRTQQPLTDSSRARGGGK